MKKSKKLLSLFLALCMALTLSPIVALAAEDTPIDDVTTQQEPAENDTYEGILPDAPKTDETETNTPDDGNEGASSATPYDAEEPLPSNNMGAHDYLRWSLATKSYLFENDQGGLTRVEYRGRNHDFVTIEDYDSNFRFQQGRSIPKELSSFGGFYAGKDYNFFVFGEANPDESDEVEVIRVVKYSKDWDRLDAYSLKGANTQIPFVVGTVSCTEYDGNLYIHTCHQMYKSDDGLNHEANMTLVVQQDDMSQVELHCQVGGNPYGYVSHSFNQLILTDQEGRIITADHGDGYPRAIVLNRNNPDSYSDYSSSIIQEFPGEDGDNDTGAALGDLAETSSGYVIAYNFFDGSAKNRYPRDVYLAYTDKKDLTTHTTVISQTKTYGNPILAPLGLEGGYIIWRNDSEFDDLFHGYEMEIDAIETTTITYAAYNANGNVGALQTAQVAVSDCQPILYNGKIVWYATNNSAPRFYTLDNSGINHFDTGGYSDLKIDDKGCLLKYKGQGGEVTIPNFVTSIGESAFEGCSGLTSVTIPDSVTDIGESAFKGCSGLASVTISNNVTDIGDSTFEGCSGLTSVAIPNSVTSIGHSTFRDCSGLISVTIPNGVTSIEHFAFAGCSGLTNVTIPNSVTSFGNAVFQDCSGLASVTIPDSVTSIGNSTFRNCSGLTNVTIPNGVTSIGFDAFLYCRGLTRVTIPNSVTSIGNFAFAGCNSLTDVYYGGNETSWAAIQIDVANANLTDAEIHYNSDGSDEPDETGFTIMFDPSGGVLTGSATMKTDADGKLTSLPSATRSGYTFSGWYTATEGGEQITISTVFTNDVTVYAYWKKNDAPINPTYAISFDANGGVLSGSATMTTNENGKLASLPSATRRSYTFDGWYTATNGGKQITTDTVFNSDATVYAHWSYNGGGGSSGGGGGSSAPNNITTTTTKNPDGSTTTTVTNNSTGAVTTTQTDAAGNKTETVAQKDGSSVSTITRKDGTTATITTSANDQVRAEVKLSAETVSAAQQNNQAAVLPIQPVQAVRDTTAAPSVTVNTGSAESVKVEIPVVNPAPGVVAILIHADGTEEIIKTSIPTANGVTVSLPDGATVKMVENSKEFIDVTAENWAKAASDFVTARELFLGTSADTFSPDQPMTRVMLMTVLARFNGVDTSGGSIWYEKGMTWAIDNGISDGSNPNGNISRQQLAVMLWRYSDKPAPTGNLDAFNDAGEVSDYAQEAMRWAVENGIINGYGDGRLNAQGQATRAEVAQMLKNFIEQ